MIPMHVNSSSGRHSDHDEVAMHPASNTRASDSDCQQSSSAPVGVVDAGGISYEPFARYELLLDNRESFTLVQPSCNTFKRNEPTF